MGTGNTPALAAFMMHLLIHMHCNTCMSSLTIDSKAGASGCHKASKSAAPAPAGMENCTKPASIVFLGAHGISLQQGEAMWSNVCQYACSTEILCRLDHFLMTQLLHCTTKAAAVVHTTSNDNSNSSNNSYWQTTPEATAATAHSFG